jgi:hypothetical protein
MTIIKYGRVLKDLERDVRRFVCVKREITSSKIVVKLLCSDIQVVRSNCYVAIYKLFGQTVMERYTSCAITLIWRDTL